MIIPGSETGTFRGMPWYPSVERSGPSSCPTCGQPTNIYKRGISVAMAKALIKLYHLEQRHPEKYWHHIREIYRERGDWAKFKFWGLIEEAENVDQDKKTSGFWRTTDDGRAFVLCQMEIPKYALVQWGSTLVGFADQAVTIKTCLDSKNKFSYQKLMESGLAALE